MPPIVSIVGKSNSGKTHLLETLVSRLKSRGYRIATIKHSRGFDLEAEGKDSWRLAEAGASTVLLNSPGRLAVIEQLDHELGLDELTYRILGQFDIIFSEGFKKSGAVKIEVHRREQGPGLISAPSELFAVVTDEPLDVSAPQYSQENAGQLADVIEQTFLRRGQSDREVELFVNGLPVPVNPFVGDMLERVLMAMFSTLKGVDVDQIKQADVRIHRG